MEYRGQEATKVSDIVRMTYAKKLDAVCQRTYTNLHHSKTARITITDLYARATMELNSMASLSRLDTPI